MSSSDESIDLSQDSEQKEGEKRAKANEEQEKSEIQITTEISQDEIQPLERNSSDDENIQEQIVESPKSAQAKIDPKNQTKLIPEMVQKKEVMDSSDDEKVFEDTLETPRIQGPEQKPILSNSTMGGQQPQSNCCFII